MIVFFQKKFSSAGGAERLLLEIIDLALSENKTCVGFCFEGKSFIKSKYGSVHNNAIEIFQECSWLSIVKRIWPIRRKIEHIIVGYGFWEICLVKLFFNISVITLWHQPCLYTFERDFKYSIFRGSLYRKFISQMKHEGLERYIKEKNWYSNLKSTIDDLVLRFLFESGKVLVLSPKAKFEFESQFNKTAKFAFQIERYVPPGRGHSTQHSHTTKSIAFLSVARLHPTKRIDRVIEAFQILTKKFNDLNLILNIVGEGRELEALQNLVADRKLSAKVFFLGFVESHALTEIMAQSNVLVALDYADFRLTTFEALKLGLRVIESDSSGWVVPPELQRFIIRSSASSIELAKNMENAIKFDQPTDLELSSLEVLLQQYCTANFYRNLSKAMHDEA